MKIVPIWPIGNARVNSFSSFLNDSFMDLLLCWLFNTTLRLNVGTEIHEEFCCMNSKVETASSLSRRCQQWTVSRVIPGQNVSQEAALLDRM